MPTTGATPVATIEPIARHTDARDLADATYQQLLADLRALRRDEWSVPTECAPWTVADMVGHLIGAAAANASVLETVRQQVIGTRTRGRFDGNTLDAVNALQVREHETLTPPERLARLQELAPAAVRGRARTPRPLRRLPLPLDQTGSTPAGMPSSLTLGHLMDVVYTRDVWLHRVDIARATGRELTLDPTVDGRIVADAVREWADRHGRAFRLTLTGPAGGRFTVEGDGPDLELDAVEFCRVLSGRAPAEGLLATRVIF